MSLRPIKDTHSISRAVANFFLAHNLPESQIILDKIVSSEKFLSYSRKGNISEKLIQFGDKAINVRDNKNNGFVLERFENGVSSDILKMENTPNGKSVLSIETRNYKRWANFSDKLQQDLKELTTLKSFYVEAIGLTYVDEFLWTANTPIDIRNTFNTNSEMLNDKFLTSKISSIVSTYVDTQIEGYNLQEERSEISFSNDLKRVTVSHTYVLQFSKLKELEVATYNEFIGELEGIHNKNKDFLREILSENTLSLINLN
jgi:uncharacterized protein (TIGR04255 family)